MELFFVKMEHQSIIDDYNFIINHCSNFFKMILSNLSFFCLNNRYQLFLVIFLIESYLSRAESKQIFFFFEGNMFIKSNYLLTLLLHCRGLFLMNNRFIII